MKRYDIYIARLDPVQGSEMGKTRPVVIVSDDLRNQLLQTGWSAGRCCPWFLMISAAPCLPHLQTHCSRTA